MFALMMVLATLLLGTGRLSNEAMQRREESFGQQLQMERLNLLVTRQVSRLGDYLLSGDQANLEKFLAMQATVLEAFEQWRDSVNTEVEDFDDEDEDCEFDVIETLEDQYEVMLADAKTILELHSSGREGQAVEMFLRTAHDGPGDSFQETLREQIADEEDEVNEVLSRTNRQYVALRWISVSLVGLGFVSMVLLLANVARRIIGPLGRLSHATECVKQGDWDALSTIESRDEIGELARSIQDRVNDLRSEMQEREKVESHLRTLNAELEQFAYVVSHDLKAPLRGIRNLVDWIISDYADKLDEDGQEQMTLLDSRVQRMHDLIEGILQYSRAGRWSGDEVAIDLDDLLPGIIDSLAPPAHIQVAIEDTMPTLQGNPTRISQVFQNLLSNAIKYMDKPQGNIRIGCTAQDGFWRFHITDNGPGIAPEFHEKVFRIFQTLSAKDPFESTGIGLSVVKKIIQNHGGRIWIESEAGRGCTFCFTYPQDRSENPYAAAASAQEASLTSDEQNRRGPV